MSDASEQTVDEETPGADAAPGTDAEPEELDGPVVPCPRRPARARAGTAEGDGDGDGDVAEIEEDLDELVEVGAQRDEYLALAQRTQADFENYRKRVARESAARAGARQSPSSPRSCCPRSTTSTARSRPRPEDDPLLRGRAASCARSCIAALARVGLEPFSPGGERFDPAVPRGGRAAAVPGRAERDRRRGLPARLPARRADDPPRPRGRRGLRSESAPMASRPDYYKILGVEQERLRRGDQEGLPQARAPVPPRPQRRRQEGRGALQGDLAGPRRPGRPREAQGVRPRHGPFATGGGPGGGFGGFRRLRLRRLRDRRHPLEPVRRRRRAAVARAAPRRAAAPRRGRDLEAEVSLSFDQAVSGRAGAAVGADLEPCPTCHGTGAKPGTTPKVCPLCEGRGIEARARGSSRSPSRARAAAAPAP